MPTQALHAPPDRKPRDDEIDIYGLTHPGKVRKDNQDHFLVCALHKSATVQHSSLPLENISPGSQRVALLMMVADGVGGGHRGEEASRLALEGVTRYVTSCMACYYGTASNDDAEFYSALQEVAKQCHTDLVRRGEEDPDYRGMATTLTLYLGVWPRGYLLQVGDSRCYMLRDGELTQITRDQTMAQAMVDVGAMEATEAADSDLAHRLTSSIGGHETHPKVTRVDLTWGNVLLLCSDGLTRHVSDERIRDVLRSMTSAKQACETLVQEALDDGGSDNVTVVVGRTLPRG
jgi:serine/threonine protein phosphatase PrpC